jgi:DNA-binding GntR family transcriptional regulator
MRRNRREEVLGLVRSEIISGSTPPGTMLSVPNLSAALGVSTTPVREALLELARAGLLEAVRNRGFRVTEPTLAELHGLLRVREVLEAHAARLAALRPDKDTALLRKLAGEIEKAVRDSSVTHYIEADRAFHRALVDLAGIDLLTETVMNLRDRQRVYGIELQQGYERRVGSVEEHYQLVDLLEAGDADRVEKLLIRHIQSWQDIFAIGISRFERSRLDIPATRER